MRALNGRIPTIALLVALLASQPILSGCTVLGLALGGNSDAANITRTGIDDLSQLCTGDRVEFHLLSGDTLNGIMTADAVGDTLHYKYLVKHKPEGSKRITSHYWENAELPKGSVASATFIYYPHEGRDAGLRGGIILDVFVGGILLFIIARATAIGALS